MSAKKRTNFVNHHESISEIAAVTASYYTNPDNSLSLNPGKDYIIQSNDILYYISLQKDESFVIKETQNGKLLIFKKKCINF